MSPHPELERLEALVRPVVEGHGLVLYELELSSTKRSQVLRVMIDRPGSGEPGTGVTIEELVAINRELSALLDIEDPLPSRYRLDVESPGIERPLTRDWHFEQAVGQQVKVVLRDPVEQLSVLEGVLEGMADGVVTVRTETRGTFEVRRTSIKKAHTLFGWRREQNR